MLGEADGTAKDLMAVESEAETSVEDSGYTSGAAVDFDVSGSDAALNILEQDYEEELTATQALNRELADAAVELATRMDDDDVTAEVPIQSNGSDAPTAELPQASERVPAEELTAEVPQVSESVLTDELTAELPQVSDTDLTAELTAELPTEAATAENDDFVSDVEDTGINAELTSEMSAFDEATVEMDIESGKVDTKKAAS